MWQTARTCQLLFPLGRLRKQHVDLQRAAGQGDAKAHSKTFGAPRRHRGRLGLWVLLRFRLTLASRALRVRALFPELPKRKK